MANKKAALSGSRLHPEIVLKRNLQFAGKDFFSRKCCEARQNGDHTRLQLSGPDSPLNGLKDWNFA
jgi:hypothetical protein